MRRKLLRLIESVMPADRFLAAIFSFIFNTTLYVLARMIAGNWHHYTLTSRLDELIPLVPESLIIYFGCYLFWIANYVIVAKMEKEWAYKFYLADVVSKIICFVFFLGFPTTNIRPELNGTGIWYQGMTFLYSVDAADNLFPSIHCLVSWFCYIGIRKRKEIPKWYQQFSCVAAVLVFVSTLTTKQHVIIDIIAGVAIAEVSFLFTRRTKWYQYYMKFWDFVTIRLFGTRSRLREECEKECG